MGRYPLDDAGTRAHHRRALREAARPALAVARAGRTECWRGGRHQSEHRLSLFADPAHHRGIDYRVQLSRRLAYRDRGHAAGRTHPPCVRLGWDILAELADL